MTNREWDEMLRQRAQKEVFQVSPKMEHVLRNTLLNPNVQKKTRRILTRGTAMALAGVMGCIGAAYALSSMTARPDATVAPLSAQSGANDAAALTATPLPYQTPQPTPTPYQAAQPTPTQTAGAWYIASQAADPQLLEVAETLTVTLDEIAANDDYISLMGGSGSIQETIRAWGEHRHTVPRAVYQAELSADPANNSTLRSLRSSASASLWTQAENRMNGALASQLNAAKNAETLVASTICTAQTAFVASSGNIGQTHYVLLYDDAAPVMVSFISYQQNGSTAVAATATFLALDGGTDLPQYLAALDTGYGTVQCTLVWQRP